MTAVPQPVCTYSSRSLVELRYRFPANDRASRDGGLKIKLLLFMQSNHMHSIQETCDEQGVITAYLRPENAEQVMSWLRQNGITPAL